MNFSNPVLAKVDSPAFEGGSMATTNNRELSWLAFNDRVLQEACDPTVPLLQRLRFLGIFSSNQDEFIKVRLSNLMRMSRSKTRAQKMLSGGYRAGELLALVKDKIDKNQLIADEIFRGITQELEDHGVRLLKQDQLSEEQRNFCLDYFANVVNPRLVPLIINKKAAFPLLPDDRIYLGVKMEKAHRSRYAIISVPLSSDCPRFIELPSPKYKNDLIFIDDVIRLCLADIFFMFSYNSICAHAFKIMRDAEMPLDDDISTSLMEKMSQGLEKRLQGELVRLAYDEKIPEDLLALLTRKCKARRAILAGGVRYHMMRDLMKFPNIRPDLEMAESPPLPHPAVVPSSSILKVIKHCDVLLSFPYQTFNHFVDFLREAAIDPKVTHIYINLYRTAENSKVINTLVNAARNGKQVLALVELMARFDEEQNMESVRVLQRAGVKVLDGIRDLKVHAKMVLVERKEGRAQKAYVYIGTGNFNETTARLYGDLGLFTAHPEIVEDARDIFDFLINTHKHFYCRQLLAAPYHMRQLFADLIDKEIKNAQQGLPAYICIKCNTLTDERMIRHLYRAGRAGVKVKLIVRGAFCLIPQAKGLSDNIEAISIVDRFLEHARFFIFCDNGRQKIYISSADWMTRNLDKRLEVAVPILDKNVKKTLLDFFDIQWVDNIKGRDLAHMGANTYVNRAGLPRISSQEALYQYYKKMSEGEVRNES